MREISGGKPSKAVQWAKKQINKMGNTPFEAKPRNYDLASAYLADAEGGYLLPEDIKENGAPSKIWRQEYRRLRGVR
ncbi:MAG TPA: hypothetical protein ENG95_05920 [Nitrospirae bacterium]|nr:hypothetical protein [Nitrospirota bacterium]